MGRDWDQPVSVKGKEMALWELIEKNTFPGVQGTPYLNNVAAKAVFFKETLSDEYRDRQFRIVENAVHLAENLVEAGYDVLTGGTDNHMVLINVSNFRSGLTGVLAQKCLEDCGIIINMNRLPYDPRHAWIASGIRLGTPIVTKNGMGEKEMDEITGMIDAVLKSVEITGESSYKIAGSFREEIQNQVKDLCSRFTMH
jgi:glycine hydroxymethyltransferase